MVQKVIKIGTSAGVTIPKKKLEELGLSVGDEVSVAVEPVVKPSAQDVRIAKRMADFIERYRDDLEALSQK